MAKTSKEKVKEKAKETIVKEEVKNENITVDIENKVSIPEKKTRKDLRKLINSDLEIAVMNNTNGGFIYECPRTHRKYEMSGYGDVDYITYEELNTMKNQHRNILERYWIIPIDVVSDEVELEEVIEYAGLKSLYKDGMLNSNYIDNLLLNVRMDKFEMTVNSANKNCVIAITERAVALFRDKRFNDYSKMSLLEKTVKDEELFKDVAELMAKK